MLTSPSSRGGSWTRRATKERGQAAAGCCCFYFFFSCWGEGCVDRHSEEREREGEENTIGNPFLICMNERGHHAHELCPPKTSHGGHEAPQNLIEFHFFAFFPSTQCVADEQQVGEKYRPVARARARRRALYALEAARDDRRVPERRGFRQRDARRGDDSHIRHAKQILSRLRQQTGPRKR